MTITEWVEMWKTIDEGKNILIPAQLHIRGQLGKLIDAFGSAGAVYDYFYKVELAEPPDIREKI